MLTTKPPRHAPKAPDADGVDVRRWPVLRDSGGNVRGYLQYASFDVPLLARLLFTRFDVAVAESPPTTGLVVAFVAWLKRRPFVYYAADVWTDGVISMGAARPIVALMRAMERTVLARAQSILSVSEEVTERLLALGADADAVATVGNGIDTEVFSPGPPVETGSGPYFIYTGTMSEWQRPDVFVRALALIADARPYARVRFFGQGSMEPELRTLAERIVPGRVDFGGVIDPAETALWIRGAAAALVSIVPGIGYDFAKPTKTYAAAACGTPVIFAGAGAGAEVVLTASLGEAVEFDAEAVAAAMLRALDAAEDGTSARLRPARASWAETNVSLSAVGTRAADAIEQV